MILMSAFLNANSEILTLFPRYVINDQLFDDIYHNLLQFVFV